MFQHPPKTFTWINDIIQSNDQVYAKHSKYYILQTLFVKQEKLALK